MPATCASAAYTTRPGACPSPATTLLTITFAERRTQRWAMCDRHTAGVHEDLGDPLFAYLRHTSVTETPIEAVSVNATEQECR
ncbi:hypothetical protein OG871_40480 (plasmid) [Kitasatospora sp. NBC_00374]|uniref:hypothetical protein n=1 Tax=Kitasatospora sp. NBC_00374 TaxID=2975964 RepID=UPI002F91B2F0